MSLQSVTNGQVSLLEKDKEDMSLTTSDESAFTIRLYILVVLPCGAQSFKAHSSAIRIVVVPKGFEKPWTPFLFESRKRLLAPAWLWMMDALVFSLCQSGGGLSHLALRLSLAQGTLNEAVRTWYSKAFATHF